MFVLGDFVFAKLHGYRPWPARVLGRYGTVSKIKYSVFFYGTCKTAKVSSSNIFHFKKNRRSLGARREKNTARNADFGIAMQQIWQAVAKPETDFEYYQVLARTKDEGESCVAYEMLKPTTESETDSEVEDSEDSQTSTREQDSAEEDDTSESENHSSEEDTTESESTSESEYTTETESSSKEDIAETGSISEEKLKKSSKKPKLSMDDQDDAIDKAQVPNVPEKEIEKGNPIVNNAHLQDLKEQDNTEPTSCTSEEQLKNRKVDKDSTLEGNADKEAEHYDEQPLNLCCRYIPGDEV